MHPLNGKIFLNEKTSSLIWTKGAEMHTHFRAFFKKFLEKIYPFTCSHWEVPNYRVFLKNFLSGKKPSHLFGIERSKRNLFFRKKAKIFLKRRFVSKHPLTCSHWQRIFGDSNLEKRQKNLPSNIGGHTFDTNNIIDFLKYSERIHIG